jgi:hypothetical protein
MKLHKKQKISLWIIFTTLVLLALPVVIDVVVTNSKCNDPNYREGYETGKHLRSSMMRLDPRGSIDLSYDSTLRIELARGHCPKQLDGEAQKKWLEGFFHGI